jgi:hypothetical protein
LIALLSYVTQLLLPVIMPIIVLLSESSKKRPLPALSRSAKPGADVLVFWVNLSCWLRMAVGIFQVIPVLGWLSGLAGRADLLLPDADVLCSRHWPADSTTGCRPTRDGVSPSPA